MDRSTRIKRYHMPTLNDTETLADTIPFKIEWSYGWNLTMGLKIILNDKSKKNQKKLLMFYASTHVGIVSEYNMETKKTQMKVLNGHNNFISSFDVSTNGRWLVTADNGQDSILVVWEIAQGTPIFTAFLPPNVGVVAVKFSINSKYLVTVSSTLDSHAQSIGLWDWTSGAEEPNHSAELGAEVDPVVHIATCPNRSNFYCFTTEKMIFFLTVEKVEDKTVLTVHDPGLDPEQKEHQYTQSVYITNFRQVLSASTGGKVSVWDDYDYNSLEITETPIKNEKRLLKTVQLQNCTINTIICQKVIMTGNANGDIFFYDKTLRILYHLKKFVGDAIVSISMLTSIEKCTETDAIEQPVQCLNSRKKKCTPDNARDSAIPNEPQLKFDSFVISTGNGRIILVEVAEQNFVQIQEPCDGSVTSSTVHPEQTFIVFGSSLGRLNMYNYLDKQFLISYVIAGDQPPSDSRYITNIEFSPKGFYLCCGTADGSFWFLNPCLLTPAIPVPFKSGNTPISHITFCPSVSKYDSSKFVVYADQTFCLHFYTMIPGAQLSANFLGRYQAHAAEVRGIVIFEDTASIMVYSVGADHRIVVFKFDKKKNERMEFVKSISTETWNEPQCIMRSTFREQVTFIISGKDLRLYEWDENSCIKTTNGVQLKTPLRILKESVKYNKVVFFCNDKSIGMLRQPIDGNPYASVAIAGSSTKLLDLDVCPRSNYLFTISENSSSGLMWSVNSNYLRKLERFGGPGLIAYSPLLDGGINGSEITRLKENFYCVQLVTSSKPEVDTVLTEFINVCDVALLMRAMGYYPSETEVENMTHEMLIRDETKLGHAKTLMTFDELVVLYLNHKPQVELKIDDIEKSFDYMVCNDPVNSCYGGTRVLTRESFVDMMMNRGEKMSFREMEILLHILSKTTEDISTGGNQQSIYLIHNILPFTFTFQELMTNLLGFKNIEQRRDKNEPHRQARHK